MLPLQILNSKLSGDSAFIYHQTSKMADTEIVCAEENNSELDPDEELHEIFNRQGDSDCVCVTSCIGYLEVMVHCGSLIVGVMNLSGDRLEMTQCLINMIFSVCGLWATLKLIRSGQTGRLKEERRSLATLWRNFSLVLICIQLVQFYILHKLQRKYQNYQNACLDWMTGYSILPIMTYRVVATIFVSLYIRYSL